MTTNSPDNTLHGLVKLLYLDAHPPQGLIELRNLRPKQKGLEARTWIPWPCMAEDIKPIPKNWLKKETYFGVALRTLNAEEDNAGDKTHTHPTHLVWVDVDLAGSIYFDGDLNPQEWPEHEVREACQRAMADVLDQCDEADLPPRAIVWSGHGLHVYWARKGRSTFEDTEAFNRGLRNLLEGDHQATDQARILRVPGTPNNKNPERPLPVEIWHADATAWVEDKTLEPLAVRQEFIKTARDGSFINNGQISDADLQTIGTLWKQLKTQKHNGLGRHQLSLYFCGWLKSNGYSEGDAYELVRKLAQEAEDEELAGRLKNVKTTYRTEADTKGWSGLKETFELDLQGIPLAERKKGKINPSAVAKQGSKEVTLGDLRDMFLDWAAEEGQYFAHYEPWDTWYQYQHGVYVHTADATMLRTLDNVLQARGFHDLTSRKLRDVLLKVAHAEAIGKTHIDQNAWELNVQNGILNLRTRELRPHTPEYFSIVQSAASWMPTHTSQKWQAFLTEALPERESRILVQQFSGYCLTGDTSAQKALLLIGEGGTGKGTFTRILTAVLGGNGRHSLAGASAMENIKDGSPQVETLVGKRMCIISEMHRNPDWLPFKRITGEDLIQVNPKFKDAYTVKLDCKLIILSNVLPLLGDDATNTSLTRRFLPVSFDIKPQNPNPHLEDELTEHMELSGILTWMVKGLQQFLDNQLRFPDNKNNELQKEILIQGNRVISFLEDTCTPTPNGEIKSSELFDAFQKWCATTNHRLTASYTTTHKFTPLCKSALSVLQWDAHHLKTGGVMVYRGLAFRSNP